MLQQQPAVNHGIFISISRAPRLSAIIIPEWDVGAYIIDDTATSLTVPPIMIKFKSKDVK